MVSSEHTFESFTVFSNLSDTLTVEVLDVSYTSSVADGTVQTRCAFQENGNHYYLEIESAGTEGVIEKYVALLFS